MSSECTTPILTILPADPNSLDLPICYESLEIIGQPCYTSKLRYRTDYETNKNRRGVLHSQNNPNYQSPAIRIPEPYLNSTHQLYIRVCLVTIVNERTLRRYIHPYKLEDINNDQYNDRHNNAVWYPIQGEDAIKSFPNLRIVRLKVHDLQEYGNFRVFDSPDLLSTPQLPKTKETIKAFTLNKSQLAFTMGKKIIGDNNIVTNLLYLHTTIFSEELIEIFSKRSDSDTATTESTTVRSHTSKSSNCQMYKYAPQSGYTDGGDEVLIFFTDRLKPKRYGDLQVTFEYDTPDGNHWSESVTDLEVKDQMVSFRTPRFPFPIDTFTTVDVILKQRKRTLEPLKFAYISIAQCPQCQRNALSNPNPITQTNPNKRRRTDLYADDEELDSMIFVGENPKPATPSTSETINSAFLSPINEDASQQILDKLAHGIASLFSNKDFLPVLRICRPFIRKRPELLHEAISKNYSDLLPNFISVAGIKLLHQKNQFGETVLLHAARLNRIDIIKAILRRENSDKLLEDINDKRQNIFHILALNMNSDEILSLLIDHLLKKSINIQETFDYVDKDNHTPLQLATLKNNLSAIRYLSKYFHNDKS